MSTTNTQGLNKLHRAKDIQLEADLKKVYNAFKEMPMTIKEADVYIGIMSENICRYVSILLIQGRIAIINERKCTVTGFPNINVYTGNPDLFTQSNQLNKNLSYGTNKNFIFPKL